MIILRGEGGIPNGDYYTVQDFAQKHDVGVPRVRQWIRRGHIPSTIFNGIRIIPVDAEPYEREYQKYKGLPK